MAVQAPLTGGLEAATTVSQLTATPRTSRRTLLALLKLAISGALIIWILRGTNVGEVLTAMRSASLPLLAAAFALNFVGYAISITRWRLLLAAQGTHARWGYLLQSYVVAIFFNNLLPSTIGGDTVRAYDSSRLTRSRSQALAVIFTDRFLGVLALMMFAIIAVFIAQRLAAGIPLLRLWLAAAAVAMLVMIWTLLLAPGRLASWLAGRSFPGASVVGRFAGRVADAFAAFRDSPRSLAQGLGLSLLLQANVVVHFFLIGRSLGFDVPFATYFLIVPLSLAIMAVPVSINAIGVRENTLAFFFAMFAIATPEAVAFAWLSYGLSVVQALAGGVVYAFRR